MRNHAELAVVVGKSSERMTNSKYSLKITTNHVKNGGKRSSPSCSSLLQVRNGVIIVDRDHFLFRAYNIFRFKKSISLVIRLG